jgi:hypothetical protein
VVDEAPVQVPVQVKVKVKVGVELADGQAPIHADDQVRGGMTMTNRKVKTAK